MTLHGAVAGAVDVNPFFAELGPATERTRERLGADTFAAAAARGSVLTLRKTNSYAMAQVDSALDLPPPGGQASPEA